MSSPVIDLSVRPVVDLLLACLGQEVAKVAKPPKLVQLRPGQQIDLLLSQNDDECCKGLAWVRVVTIFPSTNFPQPDAEPFKTGPEQWAAVLEMGVARCAPAPDVDELTDTDEWNAATYAVLDDAAAMRRALCCFRSNDRRLQLPGAWLPLPVEGGCLGGTMTVTVVIGDCDCVED